MEAQIPLNYITYLTLDVEVAGNLFLDVNSILNCNNQFLFSQILTQHSEYVIVFCG